MNLYKKHKELRDRASLNDKRAKVSDERYQEFLEVKTAVKELALVIESLLEDKSKKKMKLSIESIKQNNLLKLLQSRSRKLRELVSRGRSLLTLYTENYSRNLKGRKD